ncbi:MAG: VCBS repeat-containing protein, partial [Phycisphaerae bacterium]|nr:VCBS repeat-containing protein [Phycisphaerae bacterium]
MPKYLRSGCLLACALVTSAAGASTVPQVVVTAKREAEPTLGLIGNTARIEEDRLRLINPTHGADLGRQVAGTWLARGTQQESLPSIRSPVLTGPGSCGAFLMLEDGIPIRPAGFCNVNELFEVLTEQAVAMEALRGPSGALYGAGGMHGTLNFLLPEPGGPEGYRAAGEVGPYQYWRGKARWDADTRAGPLTGGLMLDHDGDGDTDLVAGGFGGLAVLLQDERGRLVPRQDLLEGTRDRLVPGEPRQAGEPPLWITSLALFDADGDGNLDLYAGAYVELDPVKPPVGELGEGALSVPCRWKGYEVFCGPHGMQPQADRVYRGAGDGTLFEASAKALPGHVPGYTLAVANFDFEGDGDQDVYVANDSVANLLLLNDGKGVFTDVAYSAGVALSMDGRGEAGMGVAFGDVDHDLDLDFALTNFSGEPTALYLNTRRGFRNETFRLGLQRETSALLSWSVHLEDFDGDGELELFTANGHVYPQADRPDTGTTYAQPDTLWRVRVRGDERGLERVVPQDPRSLLRAPSSSRGSAVGDFDGDGSPDLVVARIDGPPALGINRFPRQNRLVVRCVGPARSERLEADARARTPVDGSG